MEKELAPHIKRMVDEKEELLKKYNDGMKFINSEKAKEILDEK